MVKTSSRSENAKIAKAALVLASTVGWEQMTLESLAAHAKISAKHVHKQFKTVHDVIGIIAEEIDREAFAQLSSSSEGTSSSSPHDHLFEILMARFDVMQIYRKAILNMASAAHKDRRLVRALACGTLDSMYRVIDRSEVNRPSRPAIAAGLSAVFAYAYIVWSKDESKDMGKTMAALDRGLRYATKAASFLVPKD